MGRALHLMTDTVTIAHQTGKNHAGDPTYGSQTIIAARVEHKRVVAVNAVGDEVSADHVIMSESEILISDRIWMPGDNTSLVDSSRRAIMVEKATTPDGYTLYEARL